VETTGWLGTFRSMGQRAGEIARPLAGTARGRRNMGKGAAGDTTLFIDRALEDLVVEEAKNAGNVQLISEEMGVRNFGRPQAALVVDPLDGSANAEFGIGFYAVSYALGPPESTLGDIQLGYVRNLVSGEEYWAAKGKGAFRNGRRIWAQKDAELRMLLLEMSPGPVRAFENARRMVERASKIRCLGSMALDMCLVASGAASALVDLRGGFARPLDISAGKLILEEAGGVVTDGEGNSANSLPIDLETRTDILAAANRRLLFRLRKMKG
jgi:myo-inositol-1(or 4)-monophosphatase